MSLHDDILSLQAYENSVPFVVSIEKTILSNSTKNNQCTGMFVSQLWISTSCICLLQMNKEDGLFTWPPAILFRLTAGATNRFSSSRKVRFAIRILYHPKCDLKLKTMDVALMKINYHYEKELWREKALTTFPVGSTDVDFIEAALDTFIRRRLQCVVYGWPTIPSLKATDLFALDVVLVKDEECGKVTCSYVPELCGPNNFTANTKGLGFVCARANDTLAPCTGFEGAPLVCGTNVWATVTAVKPCLESSQNDYLLMTRLGVQYDFITSDARRCSKHILLFLLNSMYIFHQ